MYLPSKEGLLGAKPAIRSVKPLILHDVTNPSAAAKAAARRRLTALQPQPRAQDHARHHVSRHAQS